MDGLMDRVDVSPCDRRYTDAKKQIGKEVLPSQSIKKARSAGRSETSAPSSSPHILPHNKHTPLSHPRLVEG